MIWVGLTGGIACGKSEVARYIKDQGYMVLSADEISHGLSKKGAEGYEKIVSEFGPGIVNRAGEIDRGKMAQIVFSDKEKLEKLESILHPLIQSKVLLQREKWQEEGIPFAVYEIPLLFEKKLEDTFNCILVVSSSLQSQKERMKNRNQWSEDEIDLRLKNQISLDKKISGSHYHIENNGNLEELQNQVDGFLRWIQSHPELKSPTKG